MRALQIAVLAGAVAAAGCAATEDAPPSAPRPAGATAERCIYVSDVLGFSARRPGVVYVVTGRGETVRLETLNACTAAQGAQSLALYAPGAQRVCSAAGLEIVAGGAVAGGRCPVRSFQVLTPAEADALPREDRP